MQHEELIPLEFSALPNLEQMCSNGKNRSRAIWRSWSITAIALIANAMLENTVAIAAASCQSTEGIPA
jgi:hypothetical protein